MITVEVVYGRPDRQTLIEIKVDAGTKLEEAIDQSGITGLFPRDDLATCEVGIWGRIVVRDTVLSDGDRIEIYRPLVRDPREARRERARQPAVKARD